MDKDLFKSFDYDRSEVGPVFPVVEDPLLGPKVVPIIRDGRKHFAESAENAI